MADFLLDPETQAEAGAFIGGLSCRGKEGGSVIDASEQRLHGWPAPSHAAVLATPKTFAAAYDIKNRSPCSYPIHSERRDGRWRGFEAYPSWGHWRLVSRVACNFILDSIRFLVIPNQFSKNKKFIKISENFCFLIFYGIINNLPL